MLTLDPHPDLELAAFVATLPAPLGELASPPELRALLRLDAPAPFARETATVMPRSLKLPVGLAPSNLRWTSTSSRSDSPAAWIRGVEPSFSVTTGSPSCSERCSR